MPQITLVNVFTDTNEFDLATQINEFCKKKSVVATQIFQTPKGWTAFCYYKEEV